MSRVRAVALLALAGLAPPLWGAPPAGVDAFSPQGSVERVEQVKARFATPMVAFGDPRAAAPFTSNCGGTGRWVDSRTFVWDYARPLPGGLLCRFDLRPDLRDAAGAAVRGGKRFAFDTGGPTIVDTVPGEESRDLEEGQIFLLALNAPPVPHSVAAHAACIIDGVGEAVPLDLLPTATRDRILAGGANDWRLRWFLQQAGWRQNRDDPEAEIRSRAAIVAVKCRRALPPGQSVALLWGRDVRTASGLTAGADRRLQFKVRPAFTARFECERANRAARCLAIAPLRLSFTANVPVAHAKAIRLVDSAGKARAPTIEDGKVPTVGQVTFAPPFPEAARFRLVLPRGLRDDSGRPLANADRFPLEVATDVNPPLVKFAGTFGILEAAEGGVLPVTVRGVEPRIAGRLERPPVVGRAVKADAGDAEVAGWLRRLAAAEERSFVSVPIAGSDERRSIETTRQTPLLPPSAKGARRIVVPKPNRARAFEVVGIPLGKPGFYVVELASPRLGAALLGPGKTRYVATGALVTNMSVHFQWGRGRSLAWVTRLDDARPVAGAAVAATDSCSGKLLWQGRTDASGQAVVPDVLPEPRSYGSCEYGQPPLMVSARRGNDYSFTLTNWSEGIQPGDFNLPVGWGGSRETFHTIFDRTLIRAGDRIGMKHVVRTRTDAGFAYPKRVRNLRLTIRHLGSDQEYKLPLDLGPDGIGETSWTAPESAALGEYEVTIGEPGGDDPQVSGRFAVDEFKLPAMRAVVSGPKTPLIRPQSVPIDLYLAYMSGGGVGRAPVKLRTLVEPRDASVDDYPDFSFTGEAVKPGLEVLDSDNEAVRAPVRARVTPLTLGANGALRTVVDQLDSVTRPSRLVVEMDYEDSNGETLTATERLPLEPAAVRVGVASDGWIAKADDLRLKLVALDLAGRPVAGQRVRVELFRREVNSYRKRLIGGFYAYDNTLETKRLEAGCSDVTDEKGLAACRIDVGVSGEVIARVSARDAGGREAFATTSLWLAGDDDWWFGGDNGDRMDVVPERPEYPAGATARLQVRMPFRSATALVTVMRDGVIDSFVTELSGKDPVVAVRLKRGYAPNVYVSVLAVRGRVAGWRLRLAEFARRWNLPWISREAAAPTALVDLAKPSYRLGMARLRVGWDDHRLAVRLRPDRATYAVRQPAGVGIEVIGPKGAPPPAGTEVAVAAVDEALLALRDNDSWKLLDTMMADRPIYVFTSTAQTQVVGKRHYGLKAVPTGGGGGADLGALARREFNPLLLWKSRVRLDSRGRARVTVPLNDSLSTFRVVAVATGGPDMFGTGGARLRTTQDLMLLSGVPAVVRTGDRYVATLTLRNTTPRPLRVNVTAQAGRTTLPPRTVEVGATAARPVSWLVDAPRQTGVSVWTIAARAGRIADRVEVRQQVLPAVPVTTLQATLVQLDRPLAMPVARPADAVPGGGIEVSLSPRLAGSLAGVRDYMAAYPYPCFEQQLSKAIALGNRQRFDGLMSQLPAYLDRDGLVRFFPADWIAGDDSLTVYVLTVAHEAGWAIPNEPRAKMIAGLRGFVEGRVVRPHDNVIVFDKSSGLLGGADLGGDTAIRRLAAIAALARYGQATPTMLEPISIVPDAWPTTTLLDWIAILRTVPNVPDAAARLTAAGHVLRARLDLQGTMLNIARSDGLWWLLNSGDVTSAKLLMTVTDLPEWREDAGRIARGLMLRQRRGHWDITVANAMGTLALARFSRRYESTPVSGRTRVAIGGTARTLDWPKTGSPPPASFAWSHGRVPLSAVHEGGGAPWAVVSARAAVPLKQPFSAGFSLRRTVVPVTRAVAGRWSRGDVARIRLEFDSKSEMTWVALADPVPAGATILGGSLGGRSRLLDEEGSSEPTGMPVTYVERRQDALQAFWAWVPKGRTTYEYTVRLNAVGTFALPPTRVEAMYAPEMFAMLPNRAVSVAAAP